MTGDGAKVFLRTLSEAFDRELSEERAKIYARALSAVPDEAISPLLDLILTSRTRWPMIAEIMDDYATLVMGPDDAEEQWMYVRHDDYAMANDLAKQVGRVQNLWGPYGAVRSAYQGEMVGLRRMFLDAYRYQRGKHRQALLLEGGGTRLLPGS